MFERGVLTIPNWIETALNAEWVAIFREYNSNGAGYSPNRPEPLIVRDLSSQYEPKPVQ